MTTKHALLCKIQSTIMIKWREVAMGEYRPGTAVHDGLESVITFTGIRRSSIARSMGQWHRVRHFSRVVAPCIR